MIFSVGFLFLQKFHQFIALFFVFAKIVSLLMLDELMDFPQSLEFWSSFPTLIHLQHQLHFTTHHNTSTTKHHWSFILTTYQSIFLNFHQSTKFITIIHSNSLVFLNYWLLERHILNTNMSWNWMQSINYMKNFQHWYEILFLLAN